MILVSIDSHFPRGFEKFESSTPPPPPGIILITLDIVAAYLTQGTFVITPESEPRALIVGEFMSIGGITILIISTVFLYPQFSIHSLCFDYIKVWRFPIFLQEIFWPWLQTFDEQIQHISGQCEGLCIIIIPILGTIPKYLSIYMMLGYTTL